MTSLPDDKPRVLSYKDCLYSSIWHVTTSTKEVF